MINQEIQKQFQAYLNQMQAQCIMPDINNLKKELQKIVNCHIDKRRMDFEGYSPTEMQEILSFSFEESTPLKFKSLRPEQYMQMPIFRQYKKMLEILAYEKSVKLTKSGALPLKIVRELYEIGIDEPSVIGRELKKIQEHDSDIIPIVHFTLKESGLIKKVNGTLSLTVKGRKLQSDNAKLFDLLFKTFCIKYIWSQLDMYKTGEVGQMGFAFSLILLHKYGEIERDVNFYADKYFNAFTVFRENISNQKVVLALSSLNNCYAHRTFENFMLPWGLIELKKDHLSWEKREVKKTGLFDMLIDVIPPKN